ncbi:hypothetical protein V6Z11_D07G157500 [Gossypium hirsutum]
MVLVLCSSDGYFFLCWCFVPLLHHRTLKKTDLDSYTYNNHSHSPAGLLAKSKNLSSSMKQPREVQKRLSHLFFHLSYLGRKKMNLTQLWQMKTVKCRMNMRVKGLLRNLPLWSQFQIRILLMKSKHSDRRK